MANTNNWEYSHNLSSKWEGGISKNKQDRGNQNKIGDTIYYTNIIYKNHSLHVGRGIPLSLPTLPLFPSK